MEDLNKDLDHECNKNALNYFSKAAKLGFKKAEIMKKIVETEICSKLEL